jgi:hypothetical protein
MTKKVGLSPKKKRMPDGKMWRVAHPSLSKKEKERLVKLLMKARRDVGKAKNKTEERKARNRVHKYKVALGERKR